MVFWRGLAAPTLGLVEGPLLDYELLVFYSQLCQARGSGARRPLMRERGKGSLRAEGNRCRVPHALRP